MHNPKPENAIKQFLQTSLFPFSQYSPPGFLRQIKVKTHLKPGDKITYIQSTKLVRTSFKPEGMSYKTTFYKKSGMHPSCTIAESACQAPRFSVVIAARDICLPLAAKAGGSAHHAMRKWTGGVRPMNTFSLV